jgi:tetratricopeptide (TPR) repeat protein
MAALVFCVALAVRLWHIRQMQDTPYFATLMGDARGYDVWARDIAAGDWVGDAVFYQAPLYPYFLGLLYTVFGRDLWTVRTVQALLGALGCVLLASAGRRFFSPTVGLTAGVLLALYAPAVFFDGLIQKSSLDLFFVCAIAALVSHVATNADQKGWRWLALGLAAGLVSLTRENALLLVPIFAAWPLVRRNDPSADLRQGESPWRHRAAAAALVLAGTTAMLAPVALRNRALGGELLVTTSQFGPNFYIGNNPSADGTYASLRFGRGSPEYERQDATLLAERAEGRQLSPGEVSAYWTRRALAFAAGQPGRWLRLQLKKLALLVNAGEMLDTESLDAHAEWSWPLRLLAPVAHFGVVVPLAAIGLWVTWPLRSRLAILYAMIAAFAASTVAFYVFARYRHPLTPLLLLFAAAGMVHLWAAARGRQPRPTWGLAAATATAIVASNWPFLSQPLMHAITETNLGSAFYQDGRLGDAANHYRRAIDIDGTYAPAYNNLGVTLRAQGRVDDAIRVYRDGLRIRGDYPDLHYNLANALLERRQPIEAADHLRVAAETLPDSAGVRNNLGQALAEQGQLDAAVVELRRAVALDPSSPRAHHNLGNVLASKGEAQEALVSLRRAIDLDRGNAAAWYDAGSLSLEAGLVPDAVRQLGEAVRIAPGSAQSHNNLGIALAQSGRVPEALTEFERALALRPDFEDARRNLASLRLATDNLKAPAR